MAVYTLELLVAIGIAVACVLAESAIFLLLAKRYNVAGKPKTLVLFLISIVTLWIADSLALISMLDLVPKDLDIILVQKSSLIFSTISIVMIFFYFEAFEHDTIFTGPQLVISVLGGATWFSIIIGDFSIFRLPRVGVPWAVFDPSTDLLINLLSGVASILLIFTLNKGLHDAWKVQQSQLKRMILGVSISYLLPLSLKPIFFLYPSVIFLVFLRADVAIGFIIYFLSFGQSTERYTLYNRHRASRLIVMDSGGVPLFSHDFKERAIDALDESLLAGGITAMISLMKEVTHSTAAISEVKLGSSHCLLVELNPQIITIVIAPKSTVFLREALKGFATGFHQRFHSEFIAGSIRNTRQFANGGKDLLADTFGIQERG